MDNKIHLAIVYQVIKRRKITTKCLMVANRFEHHQLWCPPQGHQGERQREIERCLATVEAKIGC